MNARAPATAPEVEALLADLLAIADKYATMERLRAERLASPDALPDDAQLRALAARFPGFLAEIDRISHDLVRTRRADLEVALATVQRGEALDREGREALPMWLRATIEVHRSLRVVLAIKKSLAFGAPIASVFAACAPHDRDELKRWLVRLDEIARPPQQRLVSLVHADVAGRLGIPVEGMRDLLMPRGEVGARAR